MGFKVYVYSSSLPDDLQEMADTLYHKAKAFRGSQDNPHGGYNVAVFMVRFDDMTTLYVSARSVRDENEHSEDSIIWELAKFGIKKSQIIAVFSEWPPCKRPRDTAPKQFLLGQSGEATDVIDYQPHACSIMLNNILNDGTPVFHSSGPIRP